MQRSAVAVLLVAALAVAAWLPTKRVIAQAKSDFLQKVELRLGKPLSAAQRQQFARLAGSLNDALLPPQQKFAGSIAQLFGLTQAEAQGIFPLAGVSGSHDRAAVAKIETRIGRSLTPQELQQVRIADNAKKAEMGVIQAQFLADLARVTGLRPDQIMQMLPTTI